MSQSYIHFVPLGSSTSGLTKLWSVKSVAGVTLGTISWHAPWRRYCFTPATNTIFDANCLQEINNFLFQEMVKHAS